MLTILRLNWPMYAKAAVLTLAGLLAAHQFQGLVKSALLALVVCIVFWTVTSLAASWWIYDRARIYELGWLDRILNRELGTWLNLHVGMDEVDDALRTRSAAGQTLDIFDPIEITEPAIREARRQRHQPAGRQTNWRYLPAANQAFDTVLIFFAAHEFRRREARERLFIEVQRVLRDAGRVVLVEHLRDAHNFAVFGPGAFHFLSRECWRQATAPAGLVVLDDQAVTPFVHAFVLGKQCVL